MRDQIFRMEPHIPFTVLVADDATRAAGQAFDEAARLAARIPFSALHAAYVVSGGTSLATLEQMAPSLRADTIGRAAALGVNDRLLAVYLRAGDPVVAISELISEIGADVVMTTTPNRRGLMGRDVVDRLHAELQCPLVTVSPLLHAVPEIEPICAACAATRARTHGESLWCRTHSTHRIRAHGWSYQRDLPLASHDSEFVPTGTSFAH